MYLPQLGISSSSVDNMIWTISFLSTDEAVLYKSPISNPHILGEAYPPKVALVKAQPSLQGHHHHHRAQLCLFLSDSPWQFLRPLRYQELSGLV